MLNRYLHFFTHPMLLKDLTFARSHIFLLIIACGAGLGLIYLAIFTPTERRLLNLGACLSGVIIILTSIGLANWLSYLL